MNKIATYLNQHLAGEVVTAGSDVAVASTDGSVLLQKPEMVAYVASTSDIRKVARFCWQLAEKGHILPITARGDGGDATGAAIGSGVVVSPTKYMNRVIGIDDKQRLIHVQSGAPLTGVNMTLSTHKGLTLPHSSFDSANDGSIGGVIASGAVGYLNARYHTIGSVVQQLEVVLANGDILQTSRLSKRELSAKKGLNTMEGEIYRQIDNLISDNSELIESLEKGAEHDTSGYRSIVDVKNRDGSLDLTPLFVGSQGSLGIISEVIMQAQFARQELSLVLAAYSEVADAQSAADTAINAKATSVELIDGRVLKRAAAQGKVRDFAPKESFKGALVIATYDDFAERTRQRLAKKLLKQLEKSNAVHLSSTVVTGAGMVDIRSILSISANPGEAGKIVPGVFRGAWLPTVRLDGFWDQLRKLEHEYDLDLPLYVDVKSGFIDILPVFDMKKVSDRQKLLKILAELAMILQEHGGSLSGCGGDGKIKSAISQKATGEDVLEFYRQIKQIFDPYNILNPGVKQSVSTKDLVAQLNTWCRTSAV